jgi:gluconate kinase
MCLHPRKEGFAYFLADRNKISARISARKKHFLSFQRFSRYIQNLEGNFARIACLHADMKNNAPAGLPDFSRYNIPKRDKI